MNATDTGDVAVCSFCDKKSPFPDAGETLSVAGHNQPKQTHCLWDGPLGMRSFAHVGLGPRGGHATPSGSTTPMFESSFAKSGAER